jgi:hypothetical protein
MICVYENLPKRSFVFSVFSVFNFLADATIFQAAFFGLGLGHVHEVFTDYFAFPMFCNIFSFSWISKRNFSNTLKTRFDVLYIPLEV